MTAHWIEEIRPKVWELRHAIIGFTRLNNAHNGRRLGQALFKIVQRIGIEHKVWLQLALIHSLILYLFLLPASQIGHVTCDNAKNNGTMLREFATQVNRGTVSKHFDPK